MRKTAASRPAKTKTPAARRPVKGGNRASTSGRNSAPPEFIEPMKALAVPSVPSGEWRLEIKYDGFRALALIAGGEATLWSRNRKQWVDRFSGLRESLGQLECEDAILDGEIVALDARGRPSFQRLQNEGRAGAGRVELRYFVFDLLRRDGLSLLDQPIEQRQAALAELLRRPPKGVALSPVFHEPPERLLAAVREQGLEGIVAKAAGSRYEPGRRSGAWLKCRIARDQEFVIGGYTAPQGSRPYFGALLVGYYAKGKLLYAGKVGTGFDTRKLRELHRRFAPYRQERCPFANLPTDRRSRFGQTMNAAAMRTVTWLRPELVAQIKFAEWTDDGALRHPVFLGLREDKPASEVVREASAGA